MGRVARKRLAPDEQAEQAEQTEQTEQRAMDRATDQKKVARGEPRELLAFMEARRLRHDQLLWQVPALAMATEAFLLAAAFNDKTPDYARIAILVMGLVVLGSALQLLLKARYLEEVHGDVVDYCRGLIGWPDVHHKRLAASFGRPETLRWMEGWRFQRVANQSTFVVWLVTLCLLVGVDGGLLGKVVYDAIRSDPAPRQQVPGQLDGAPDPHRNQ
jgi:hypothetical protein